MRLFLHLNVFLDTRPASMTWSEPLKMDRPSWLRQAGSILNRSLRKSRLGVPTAITVLSLLAGCTQEVIKLNDGNGNSSLESDETLTDSEKYTANQEGGLPAKTPDEIEDFWTEERMKSAKPMPTPKSVIPEHGGAAIPEGGWPTEPSPEDSPSAMPRGMENSDPID